MRALITGGAGFIGGHLASSLSAAGCAVDIVDNFARGVHDEFVDVLLSRRPGSVRLVGADLLAPDGLASLAGPYDYIYHLAAIVGVQHVLSRPYEVLSLNAAMTDRVLTLARRQPSLKRLVFASTSEVYAGTLLQGMLPIPTPETAPIVLPPLAHPRTGYMLSKLYGEAMCQSAGIPITIVRPHNVYGPRMGLSHVIPELLKRAYDTADGSTLEVYSADHRRTFCFVDDAVPQIRGAAESAEGIGATINIGTSSPEVTIGELAEIVVRTVGKHLRIMPGPTTPGSPARRCPDTRLADALSGHRTRVSLEDGIARTFAWYKEAVFATGGSSAI